MIPAEEALQIAAGRDTPQSLEPGPLSEEEVVVLNYLDSMVESAIVRLFNGGVFYFPIPIEKCKSPAVIRALIQRYESGRWLVGVAPMPHPQNPEMVAGFNVMFAPKQFADLPEKHTAKALPMVLPMNVGALAEKQARILVRMPTRGRHAQAIHVLDLYRGMAGRPIEMEVVVDFDDDSVTSEVLFRYHALGARVCFGAHKSKIEACNGGAFQDWDILLLASDDMVPVADGWASRIEELFQEHWPHFDGAIWQDDGYAHDRVCTLSIMGRRLYEKFGYVYHPSYKSVFCDDEYGETLKALGRIVYVPEMLIEHHHPAAGKGKTDELYVKNDTKWAEDEANCKARRSKNFGQPEVLLSILVATFPERYEMLEKLLDYLTFQIWRWQGYALKDQARPYHRRQIEIVIDDKPAPSLGEKRQRLLDRAKGRFIAFVDDDDTVSPDYIERVVGAIEREPNADCCSLVGIVTVNGNKPERFEHSLKYDKWATLENGLHIRTPNHLNAVRRSIALEVGFAAITYTEDHDFSRRLYPRLKTEADTGDTPLYHYFSRAKIPHAGAVQ
jgi:glycosyltransferase involved in cell wall biosynthesis